MAIELVIIDADEMYPVFAAYKPERFSSEDRLIAINAETLERWSDACRAWSQAQREMQDLFEAVNNLPSSE